MSRSRMFSTTVLALTAFVVGRRAGYLDGLLDGTMRTSAAFLRSSVI